MSHLTLIPAYGRDYKSKAEVLAAWFADKDFLATGYGGGGYINRPQVTCDVHIRYKQSREVCVIPLGMKPPKVKAPKVKPGLASTLEAQAIEADKLAKPRATLRGAYDYEREDAPEDFPG